MMDDIIAQITTSPLLSSTVSLDKPPNFLPLRIGQNSPINSTDTQHQLTCLRRFFEFELFGFLRRSPMKLN